MHMNKKKMLIVGGGYADIPLILAAKKIGYYVITTGNNPTELGHQYSDEYYNVDFSNCEAIFNLSKKLNIDAICSSCNDFSALSAAYTAEKLGLPGHDSYKIAQIIHHKDEYRKFALENNIPSPRAMGFNDKKKALEKIEQLQFPIIVKPVDLTGGKGISVVNSKNEVHNAIEKAFEISRIKRIVIEEFVDGSRHGFSAFLHKGKVKFYFSDNEYYYLNQYMVSGASTPSMVDVTVEQKLCSQAEKIASLLNLKDGIFHVQYILKNNEPIIIEICRRAPGDLYIKFVEYATKVDYPMWIVKASAGIDCSDIKHSRTQGYFTRHCIMSSKLGEVKDITFDSSISNNIIDKLIWGKKGDMVTDIMTSKFGIVFLKYESEEEMIGKTNSLNELIQVQVE